MKLKLVVTAMLALLMSGCSMQTGTNAFPCIGKLLPQFGVSAKAGATVPADATTLRLRTPLAPEK